MRTVIEINGRRYDARTGEILEQKISPKNTDDSKVVAKQLPTKDQMDKKLMVSVGVKCHLQQCQNSPMV